MGTGQVISLYTDADLTKALGENETKEEKQEDIKSKIKAFEVKKDAQVHPSPESVKPTKKRPGSEAFKVFENKGIIMGMYRKAAPPKGRNRSSRAFRLQQVEQSQSNLLFDMGMSPSSQTGKENNTNPPSSDRLGHPEMTEKKSRIKCEKRQGQIKSFVFK
ncbi:hypothetical protein KUTeg_004242 [Tegillarca granosa]|uniref:Uncharacterized protein n=1 Tax=Tegillarca granosa TaxID=220873 RepID=A0ABQ9FSJ7_TEGGR|nr:hypothetical protein KUTeg_004242 [Tegillarca granosa]